MHCNFYGLLTRQYTQMTADNVCAEGKVVIGFWLCVAVFFRPLSLASITWELVRIRIDSPCELEARNLFKIRVVSFCSIHASNQYGPKIIVTSVSQKWDLQHPVAFHLQKLLCSSQPQHVLTHIAKLALCVRYWPTTKRSNHFSPTTFNTADSSNRMTSLKTPLNPLLLLWMTTFCTRSVRNSYKEKANNARSGFQPEHRPILHPQDIVPGNRWLLQNCRSWTFKDF